MGLAEARTWLASQRNPDGSWGFVGGQPGHPEPTLLAAAAGLPAAIPWLDANRDTWATLLLPAVLAPVPEAAALVSTAVDDILGRTVSMPHADGLGHDTTIPGWSWYPDTAAWVEPTAYAVISLRRAGKAAHEHTANGIALLRNRQCVDGGWNYGNVSVLDTQLDSFIATTAWAVMALPYDGAVERGLARLINARERPSTLGLAVSILALTAHGRDAGELVARLRIRQADDGNFDNRVDRTAIAATAIAVIEEGQHGFVSTPHPP
jgi:hypothetical protein